MVARFCAAVPVTQGFRWTGTREQMLQTMTMQEGLLTLTSDMMDAVRAHVNLPVATELAEV